MLVEYLTGEAGGPEDQQLASQISRLIIAGNSLSLVEYSEDGEEERKPVSQKTKLIMTHDEVDTRENSAPQHRQNFLLTQISRFQLIFWI
jgi:hypothetical protein